MKEEKVWTKINPHYYALVYNSDNTAVLFTVIILLSIEDSFNSKLYSLILNYLQKHLVDFVTIYGVFKSLYHSYSLHIQCSQCV